MEVIENIAKGQEELRAYVQRPVTIENCGSGVIPPPGFMSTTGPRNIPPMGFVSFVGLRFIPPQGFQQNVDPLQPPHLTPKELQAQQGQRFAEIPVPHLVDNQEDIFSMHDVVGFQTEVERKFQLL